MIDNIRIAVPLEDGQQWQSFIHYDTRTGQDHYSGHIKNLKIVQNLNGVYIQGSIAKYLQGENITPLTRNQVKESLDLIQQDTGMSFHNAVIISLEIGSSVILKNPVCLYLSLFDYMQKYTRSEHGKKGLETVTYQTKTGSISFYAYDKTKEVNDRKQTIPELYKDCNVMRLEYRIKKRQGIKSLFKRDLQPKDLYNFEVYQNLQRQYYDFYTKIPKTGREVFFDFSKPATPAKIEKLLAETFRQTNPKEYSLILQTGKDAGFLTEKTLERIRSQERQNSRNFTFTDTNDLIIELNEKMQSRACYGA